jgi:hypothetical protein
MMIALLVAGALAILAGLVGIVYGLLLELSFGNTLILAGAFGVCSGMMVLAQALVVHELRNLARRLGPRMAVDPRPRPGPPTPPQGSGQDGLLFPRAQGAAGDAEPAPSPVASPPPWREEAASRDSPRQELLVPPPEQVEPVPPPRRRNLLFSSSVRKHRERLGQPGAGDAPSDRAGLAPEAGDAPPSFENTWPRPERQRPSEMIAQRRANRTPPVLGEAGALSDQPAPAGPGEAPAVTVVKSGVVDGMAYTLYSDGSIEAQMPEGMMHFASIDELRAHLDHRS